MELEGDEALDLDGARTRHSKVSNEVGESIPGHVSILDGGMVLAPHVSLTRNHNFHTYSQVLDIPNRPSDAGSYHGSEYPGSIGGTRSSNHQGGTVAGYRCRVGSAEDRHGSSMGVGLFQQVSLVSMQC